VNKFGLLQNFTLVWQTICKAAIMLFHNVMNLSLVHQWGKHHQEDDWTASAAYTRRRLGLGDELGNGATLISSCFP